MVVNVLPVRNKIPKEIIHNLEKEAIYNSKKRWAVFKSGKLVPSGIYSFDKARIGRGQIIITKNRLVALMSGYKIVDVPKEKQYLEKLMFDTSNKKRFKIIIDFSKFSANGQNGVFSLNYFIPAKEVIGLFDF